MCRVSEFSVGMIMLQGVCPHPRLSSVRYLCPPPTFSLLFSTLHFYLEQGKAPSVQKGVCEFTRAALGTLHHPLGAAEWQTIKGDKLKINEMKSLCGAHVAGGMEVSGEQEKEVSFVETLT